MHELKLVLRIRGFRPDYEKLLFFGLLKLLYINSTLDNFTSLL